jgi:hypothetical protein
MKLELTCSPAAQPAIRADRGTGMLAGLRTPAVVKPAIIFAATTMAAGIFGRFRAARGARRLPSRVRADRPRAATAAGTHGLP